MKCNQCTDLRCAHNPLHVYNKCRAEQEKPTPQCIDCMRFKPGVAPVWPCTECTYNQDHTDYTDWFKLAKKRNEVTDPSWIDIGKSRKLIDDMAALDKSDPHLFNQVETLIGEFYEDL